MRAAKVVQGVLSLPLRLRAMLLDKGLGPATAREQALIDELRASFNRSPNETETTVPWWAHAQERLRELVMTSDPREFTRWDIIRTTMFLGQSLSVAKELGSLKRDRTWESVWKPAIVESRYGRPVPYFLHAPSSGNLIHHAYHLQQVVGRAERAISDYSFIFEFGGGYGSMRRLAHNLGFRGRYVIVDLPPFSLLQRFYLRLLEIPVDREGAVGEGEGTTLSTDIGVAQTLPPSKPSLFIATWSLSETPEEFRVPLFNFVAKFDAILIAYLDEYSGVDNIKFFGDWRQRLEATHECADWEIAHARRNRYMVCKRRGGVA